LTETFKSDSALPKEFTEAVGYDTNGVVQKKFITYKFKDGSYSGQTNNKTIGIGQYVSSNSLIVEEGEFLGYKLNG
jgi:hypothetical protein